MADSPVALIPTELVFPERFKQNFAAKVKENNKGCWIWTASKDKDGYGQVRFGKSIVRAHRISYIMHSGMEIPEGYDVDHLCHMRDCVNPEHLEIVTHAENMARMHDANKFVNSWELVETTPDAVIRWAHEIMDRSEVVPYKNGGPTGGGYGIQNVQGAPWRNMHINEGYIHKGEPMALIGLFLECLALGVPWPMASQEILDIHPFTMKMWRQNPDFKEDMNAAKAAGKKSRYEVMHDLHMDALEQKIGDASFDEVSKSLERLNKLDAEKTSKAAAIPLAEGASINITVITDRPREALRDAWQMIEATAKELPAPDDESLDD